jgi:hypothetical protein
MRGTDEQDVQHNKRWSDVTATRKCSDLKENITRLNYEDRMVNNK